MSKKGDGEEAGELTECGQFYTEEKIEQENNELV